MHNIPPLHRQKIQKAMSDPRYWNKKHPEHAEAFANAQRAFEDAYRESPLESETSPESVHVRAYTRTQDGKEIEVSAYDRIQQVALRGPTTLQAPPREDIIDVSNNEYHDKIQNMVVQFIRQQGGRAEKDVRIYAADGTKLKTYPDALGVFPDGIRWNVEVKTGKEPRWTDNQPIVYPLMEKDYLVYSDDPKIERLGFKKNELLPAFCAYVAYADPVTGFVKVTPMREACCASGKRIDDLFKMPSPKGAN